MTEAEQLAGIATSRGFDDLTSEERRRRARELLALSELSDEESVELDVLLLMAVGLSEASARADLLLRRRQNRHIQEQNKSP